MQLPASVLSLEENFLENLVILQEVYISLVQRETVVPVPIQEELWQGFPSLLDAQKKFVVSLKSCDPSEWDAQYRVKVELLEQPLCVFCGNLPRAVGRLFELIHSNQWKAYMESAEQGPKVKGKDMHHFLTLPRSHLRQLSLLLPDGSQAKQQIELLELRVRCVAGKGFDVKAHASGLLKQKGLGTEMTERSGRRLLREGKFVSSEDGKKGKDGWYWLFDDCLAFGNKEGGACKGWLRLITLQCSKSVDGLELKDSLNKPVFIHCDESSKVLWESELVDWALWCVECDRRQKIMENQRMVEKKQKMEEAVRMEAERKAREEAERKARQEEAVRQEAERKAKEEADRKARIEEAARQAKEEAERKAKEDAERMARLEEATLKAKKAAVQPPPLSLPPPPAMDDAPQQPSIFSSSTSSIATRPPPPLSSPTGTPPRSSNSNGILAASAPVIQNLPPRASGGAAGSTMSSTPPPTGPRTTPQASPRPEPLARPAVAPRSSSTVTTPITTSTPTLQRSGSPATPIPGPPPPSLSTPTMQRNASSVTTIPGSSATGANSPSIQARSGAGLSQSQDLRAALDSTAGSGPRLPIKREIAPPPWDVQAPPVETASQIPSTAVTGPRLPVKREIAPPPWEKKK